MQGRRLQEPSVLTYFVVSRKKLLHNAEVIGLPALPNNVGWAAIFQVKRHEPGPVGLTS
jgi:hypothetical protein